MSKAYEQLSGLLEKTMALQTSLILFEWDNETLAPEEAGSYTAKVIGILSEEYYRAMTDKAMEDAIEACEQDLSLTSLEKAIVRETKEERERLVCIPSREYREFAQLTAESTRVWMKARQEKNFDAFAPTLEKVIQYQKKFASYRAKEGEALYNVMLDGYEKGVDMNTLDRFFGELKETIVPLLRDIKEKGRKIPSDFLQGDYPEDKQRLLAVMIGEYMGFDFKRGVLGVSAHPFTTNLHNHDVRITTSYNDHVDSSLFSVIHEAGHGLYELGIADELTQTPVGQGASMGMHESQSRFFENIVGRNENFWVPIYGKVQELFPEQLKDITLKQFVDAINKAEPGLIRTEADELTYSLHVMIRYELEKMIVEDNLDIQKLPKIWADKYEEYLGVRPANPAEGVLQDIHWSQGSFGYFPSYALGNAFGAQLYYHMRKIMDFDGLLREGKIDQIRDYLREHIHQYGKLKTSRELLKDTTGEDFNPSYYVQYLKEKFSSLYGLS